jgi:hypothetical protein
MVGLPSTCLAVLSHKQPGGTDRREQSPGQRDVPHALVAGADRGAPPGGRRAVLQEAISTVRAGIDCGRYLCTALWATEPHEQDLGHTGLSLVG